MKIGFSRKAAFSGLVLLFLVPGLLFAVEKRSVPLDLCLIIDGSSFFSEGKAEALSWINRELIDDTLQEGDTLSIWSAGETAALIYSETVGAQKETIKNMLQALETSAETADFSGALKEMVSRGGTNPGRMSVTMIVAGSALALAPSMKSDASLFRWSRVEEYNRWQLMVVSQSIMTDVRRAASDYMRRL